MPRGGGQTWATVGAATGGSCPDWCVQLVWPESGKALQACAMQPASSACITMSTDQHQAVSCCGQYQSLLCLPSDDQAWKRKKNRDGTTIVVLWWETGTHETRRRRGVWPSLSVSSPKCVAGKCWRPGCKHSLQHDRREAHGSGRRATDHSNINWPKATMRA